MESSNHVSLTVIMLWMLAISCIITSILKLNNELTNCRFLILKWQIEICLSTLLSVKVFEAPGFRCTVPIIFELCKGLCL